MPSLSKSHGCKPSQARGSCKTFLKLHETNFEPTVFLMLGQGCNHLKVDKGIFIKVCFSWSYFLADRQVLTFWKEGFVIEMLTQPPSRGAAALLQWWCVDNTVIEHWPRTDKKQGSNCIIKVILLFVKMKCVFLLYSLNFLFSLPSPTSTPNPNTFYF